MRRDTSSSRRAPRALLLVLAPLAGALAAIALSVAATSISSAATRTTAVKASLRDYRISLDRSRVLPGRVRFRITNRGDDPHNLRVSGPSGSSRVRGTSRVLSPGQSTTLTVRLGRTGRYRLICTVGNHEEMGMRTTLRVVRRR